MRLSNLLCIGALVTLLAACGGSAPTAGPKIGSIAPDFTLQTPEDASLTLSSLRGQAVLVNFWATWCGPCKDEMPRLEQAYKDHKGQLQVIGVDLDESAAQVTGYTDSIGVSFKLVLDKGQRVAKEQYHIFGAPSTFLLDKNGVIRDIRVGPFTDQKDLANTLKKVGL